MSRLFPLAALAALLVGTASAQPFTEDAVAVSPGRASIEVGVTLEGYQAGGLAGAATDEAVVTLPEALVRVGLVPGIEARLSSPNYSRTQILGVNAAVDGLGDPTIGLKAQLGMVLGADVALVVETSVPVADRLFDNAEPNGDRFFPGAILSVGHRLDEMFSLEAQVQGVFFGEGNGPSDGTASVNVTAVLHAAVGDPFSVYAELALEDAIGGSGAAPFALVHTGGAMALSARSQVDVEFGLGLSGFAPDYLIGIGATVEL